MLLYHGTTGKRAEYIFADKAISNNCERFFTEEENGSGYTTQGYVYLTNEITFAAYFANSHTFMDQSKELFIFRVDVPDELIEPDYDEMRYQDPTGYDRERYSSDLECSLAEFKTCRIPISIEFDSFAVEYFSFNKADVPNIANLFDNAGCNYNYVVENYSAKQRAFIDSIHWKKLFKD